MQLYISSSLFANKEEDIFTLYDAVAALSLGWKPISEANFSKCWNKILKEKKVILMTRMIFLFRHS